MGLFFRGRSSEVVLAGLLVRAAGCVMAWEQEDDFDLDLGFEEAGERFDDPWRGPFLDQSSSILLLICNA